MPDNQIDQNREEATNGANDNIIEQLYGKAQQIAHNVGVEHAANGKDLEASTNLNWSFDNYKDTNARFPMINIKVDMLACENILNWTGNSDLETLDVSLPMDCSQQIQDQVSTSYKRKSESTIMNTAADFFLATKSPSIHRFMTTDYDPSSIYKKITVPWLMWVTPEWPTGKIMRCLGALQTLCYPLHPLYQIPSALVVSIGAMYKNFTANLASVSFQTDSDWLTDNEKPGGNNLMLEPNSFPMIIRGTFEFINLHVYTRNSFGVERLSLKGFEWRLFGNENAIDLGLTVENANTSIFDESTYTNMKQKNLSNRSDYPSASVGDYNYRMPDKSYVADNGIERDPIYGQRGYLSEEEAAALDKERTLSGNNLQAKYNMNGTNGGVYNPQSRAIGQGMSGSSSVVDDITVADTFKPTTYSPDFSKYSVSVEKYIEPYDSIGRLNNDIVNSVLTNNYNSSTVGNLNQTSKNVKMILDQSGTIRNINNTLSTISNVKTLSDVKNAVHNVNSTIKRIESGSIKREFEDIIYRHFMNLPIF